MSNLKTLEPFGYFGWNAISKEEFLIMTVFNKSGLVPTDLQFIQHGCAIHVTRFMNKLSIYALGTVLGAGIYDDE